MKMCAKKTEEVCQDIPKAKKVWQSVSKDEAQKESENITLY